jgi:hypothetical protein
MPQFYFVLQQVFFELQGRREAKMFATETHALDEVRIGRIVKLDMRSHVQGTKSTMEALLRWLGHTAERLLSLGAARLQVLPHSAVGGKQLVASRAYENGCWHVKQPEIRNSIQFSRSIPPISVKVKFGCRTDKLRCFNYAL